MTTSVIDRLIICSPYSEPEHHWSYDAQTEQFSKLPERRSAGFVTATPNAETSNDPGIFQELPLVNKIRERVRIWREEGYPGVTAVSRRLLQHWMDSEDYDYRRFFFCQIEAIETIIWLAEAPATYRTGVEIPTDGGDFVRYCAKMATGTGKTVVMAMLLAWQILNKVARPNDGRFSKNVLVITPGLTVRKRLSVLDPTDSNNYYDEFRVVPLEAFDKLRQGRVLIRNWQSLQWESAERIAKKRSVDKRGALSDEAYIRKALGAMASARNILIVNDEAHHAWRIPAGTKGISRAEIEAATKWVGSLDRIHSARGIHTCYDFSATPFIPSGRESSKERLFSWIVSDFGLNDAIESGLVKTPRVVVRDDSVSNPETFMSRFYHIYGNEEVKSDLNSKAMENVPLPELVVNAYHLLGQDWLETKRAWSKKGGNLRPVMITAANRTETAARIKYAFDHGHIGNEELHDRERTLHIDTKAIKKAEAATVSGSGSSSRENKGEGEDGEWSTKLSAEQRRAEDLRVLVNTVGQPGMPGEHIQNVISVDMLSEGWDAKTVTHIMGLRAFHSQLLCEQVVGRGLRRQSYDVDPDSGLFKPEYVNVFGVPFTFLPHERPEDTPRAERSKLQIGPVLDKSNYEIAWPNVMHIYHALRSHLTLDWDLLLQRPLILNASETAQLAELAPVIDRGRDMSNIQEIDLLKLASENRMQRVVFRVAAEVFEEIPDATKLKGNRADLLSQIVRITNEFMMSAKGIEIFPKVYGQDRLRRQLVLTLNMKKILQHLGSAIRQQNEKALELVLSMDKPILSTGDMRTWFTGKQCGEAKKSHINRCVYDSRWEQLEAFVFDRSLDVEAWVKNDHLGFEIQYLYKGVVRKYRPDFLIRLVSKRMLVLEVKGVETEQDKVKWVYLDEWVRAVNQDGRYGLWSWAVSKTPGDVMDILKKHSETKD